MESKARIRINLSAMEIEIEGSEDFVNAHSEKLQDFLDLLNKQSVEVVPTKTFNGESVEAQTAPASSAPELPFQNGLSQVPESFGEFYNKAHKNIHDIDKVLLGGYFVQSKNDGNIFSTREVSSILKDQGINLSNPAHFVKLNLTYKRVFAVKKGWYRISETGMERLTSVIR